MIMKKRVSRCLIGMLVAVIISGCAYTAEKDVMSLPTLAVKDAEFSTSEVSQETLSKVTHVPEIEENGGEEVKLQQTPTPEPTVTPEPTLTVTPEPTAVPTSPSTETQEPTKESVLSVDLSVGDCIVYGSYPKDAMAQDMITDAIVTASYDDSGFATVDGQKYARVSAKESHIKRYNTKYHGDDVLTYYSFAPIEWLVLETNGNKALVISKNVLEGQAFDTKFDRERWASEYGYVFDTTWEDSTVRAWLNDAFYNTAFSKDEQEGIVLSEVQNEPNSKNGLSSGADTEDFLFLLSEAEALEYFDEKLLLGRELAKAPEDKRHLGNPTEYALGRGTFTREYERWHNVYCDWFLRTTGTDEYYAEYIVQSGLLDSDGVWVDRYCGIRPCFWLDMTTEGVEKVD